MGVFNTIGRIFSTVFSVVGQLRPILDVLKQLIPGLRESMDHIEGLVGQGEEEADDFVDAHRDDIEQVRDFAYKLEVAGAGLKNTLQMLLDAADTTDDTPEAVTAEEMAEIYQSLRETIEQIIDAGEAADEALTALDKLKK